MRQMIITLVGEYIGETNEDKRNPELCPNEEKSWEVMSTQFSDVTTSQEPSHCCQFGLLLFTLCFILPRQWWYILWSDEVLSARPTLCKTRVDVFSFRGFRQNERTWWKYYHNVSQKRMKTAWEEQKPIINVKIESRVIITVFFVIQCVHVFSFQGNLKSN